MIKKNNFIKKILIIQLSCICILLASSCNNKENAYKQKYESTEEQDMTEEDEVEEGQNNKELYIGNTIKIKKVEYDYADWNHNDNKKTENIEFIILDYDDEKVLVTTKYAYFISYYYKSPSDLNDLTNWKHRYSCSFDFSDIYKVHDLALSLEQVAIKNTIRNKETDSDVFIMSKDDIKKYFIDKKIDLCAESRGSSTYTKEKVSYILRDSYLDDVCLVDENGEIVNKKHEAKKYSETASYHCRYSMFLDRKYVEKVLSGFYVDNEKLNNLIKDKYINEKVEVSRDGKTAYVKDYIGGRLDVKKYGKYEVLDFSKNESKHIMDASYMFSEFSSNNDYNDENNELHNNYLMTKEINLKGLDLSNCYTIDRMFSDSTVEKINFEGVDLSNVFSSYKVFNNCQNLKSIKGLNLNSKTLSNLRGAFFKCVSLSELELLDIDTENVNDMAYMFYRCQNLEKLDVSKFDTKNVKDMSYMFGNMRKLKELDLSNFNTGNVTNMSHMFYRCENLTELDLSAFNTQNVFNLSYMFYCCYNLKNVDISSFDTSKCVYISYFMYFCNSLKELHFDNFKNYTNIIECNYMFRYCEDLTKLSMKNANLPYLYGKYIFDGCLSLTDYSFDLDTLNNIPDGDKTIFGVGGNFTSTGQIDGNVIYRVENNTDDSSASEGMWNESKWTLNVNAQNIKKQIEDLSVNIKLIKFHERKKSITNRDIMFIQNNAWEKLLENEFLVKKEYQYMEFYNYYEETRYNHFPNFVTSDSMLHTYHLYFDYLMKKIEKTTLFNKISKFSREMLEISKANYDSLKGTVFENSAKTVVAYFTVPTVILDKETLIESYVKDIVNDEINKIEDMTYIGLRPLFNEYYDETKSSAMLSEDYTQFKPRGHYTDDDDLAKYFKILMWYGRTNFATDYDALNKSALLISVYLNNDKLYSEYNAIKDIIYYFSGEPDDITIEQYMKAIKTTYGDIKIANIISNIDKYSIFVEKIKELKKSNINTTPLMFESNENNVNFKLLGQAYTYDEDIFTNMMYDKVLKDEKDEKRYLPDFLDVPASLNSDVALKILKEENKTEYPNYMENLQKLRERMTRTLKDDNKNILYNKWMKALYSLIELENNDEELPSFMKNDEWKKKSLETFGGSYAELKHDTILYTKQAFGASECGEGGEDEFYDKEEYELDTKGYVEPVTKLYDELANMSHSMKNLFSLLNLLDSQDIEFLDNFYNLALKLEEISNKELNNVELSDEEYELIEGYGATIEHLIIDSGAYAYGPESKYYDYAPQPSSAIVADIATGDKFVGDFRSLEIATGNPIRVFILVNVGGKYKICQGAVYDFYQFEIDSKDRMNDIEWRLEMGFDSGYKKTKDGEYIDWGDKYEDWGISLVDEGEDAVELEAVESHNLNLAFQNWTESYKEKGTMFSERINTYFIDHCGSYRSKNICDSYENY